MWTEVKQLSAGSPRRHKGFFWSLIKRKSKSSHSGQHITDRDATSNIDVDGQDGNEKRRRRRRRWERKARSGRYDDSDVSPLISSGSSEDELVRRRRSLVYWSRHMADVDEVAGR